MVTHGKFWCVCSDQKKKVFLPICTTQLALKHKEEQYLSLKIAGGRALTKGYMYARVGGENGWRKCMEERIAGGWALTKG